MIPRTITRSCLVLGFTLAAYSTVLGEQFTTSEVPPIETVIKNFRELDEFRNQREWKRELTSKSAATTVAFSVSGDNMASSGNETVITYDTTHTNTHRRAWISSGSHFRVPVAGVYLFTLSFTNEKSHGSDGDDVYVVIRKNGESKGFGFAGAASSGGTGSSRKTGTYTVAIDLAKNDVIHTGVVDDFKRTRFIRFFNLTGVLVAPQESHSPAATGR